MKIEVECKIEPFKQLYNLPKGTNLVICVGGRGGAKTYSISQWIAFQSTIKRKRCAILRDEKSTIRESILNEVLLRYDTANETGVFNPLYQKGDSGIKDKHTGEMMVFTKGFRASSNLKTANLKSISNVDIAVIEEAEDLASVEKYSVFADSIRKEGSIIVLVLNTPPITHWIVKRYFNCFEVQDGYYRIEPKNIPGFVCIQTSYKDNPFLPYHIVSNYKGYGDPNHQNYDPHYFLTAIEGYASTGRRGQILRKVKPISLKEYMALPYKEMYGQDFGTAAPAGMIGAKFHKNTCWARQINYLPMETIEIGRFYCKLQLAPNDLIVADYADKDAIKKLKHGWKPSELSEEDLKKYPQLVRGFNIRECVKGSGSVQYGISVLNGLELYIVEESKDFWNEVYNRIYAQNKSGEYTNDPEPGFDHLQDPLMYLAVDQKGKQNIFGI